MHAGFNTPTFVLPVALAVFLACAHPTMASVDVAALCDDAARSAAADSGVPADVLRALTRTETGRASGGALRPWPWAINHGGEGRWFATQDDMLDHINALVSSGISNFDVGCFQLNYRWHAQGFASLPAMADPAQNARYAAGYLAQKYAALGDWGQAAAAYHSGTPDLAARYLTRFSAIYTALEPAREGPATPAVVVREPDRPNLFPLLIAGQSGGGGSLVPMSARGRRLFGSSE